MNPWFCRGMAMAVAPRLALTSLSVRYGRTLAVDGVSLSVKPGEVVGLLGPNGAGKSSLLACVAGRIPRTDGDITVHTDKAAAVGFAGQPPALYEYLSTTEFLQFFADGRALARERAKQAIPAGRDVEGWIRALGLWIVRDRLCRELSFGTRQRVALASALVGDTECILLDETLNGLDPHASKLAVDALLARAEAGATILMATHMLDIAHTMCSRFVIMDGGRIIHDIDKTEWEKTRADGIGALESLYLSSVRSPYDEALQ